MSSLESIACGINIPFLHSVKYSMTSDRRIAVTLNQTKYVGTFNGLQEAQQVVSAIKSKHSTLKRTLAAMPIVNATSAYSMAMNGTGKNSWSSAAGEWPLGVPTANTGSITYSNTGARLMTHPGTANSRAEIRDSGNNRTPSSPPFRMYSNLGKHYYSARAYVEVLGVKALHILGFYRTHSQTYGIYDVNNRVIEMSMCFLADFSTGGKWYINVTQAYDELATTVYENLAYVDTGITHNTAHDFHIETNEANTKAFFYIDNVLIYTHVGLPDPDWQVGMWCGAAIRDTNAPGNAVAAVLNVSNMILLAPDNPQNNNYSDVAYSISDIVATPQTPLYSIPTQEIVSGQDVPISYKFSQNNNDVQLYYKAVTVSNPPDNLTLSPQDDGFILVPSQTQIILPAGVSYVQLKCNSTGYTAIGVPKVTTVTYNNTTSGSAASTFTMTYTNPAP
jgi:hypothetical protein